jgi:alkylation response protein AidB-like acyl-CoA dehydrogenase
VDLRFPEADLAFATEVRDWLREHLTGRFAALVGRGGSGNEEFYELRVEWERELHAGGWTGLGWPPEYGGRPATVTQRVLFEYEYARAGGPYRAGFQGTNLLGPTLIEHGTPDQKRRFLPRILSGEEVWCQGFSEPGAGSDLASVRTKAVLVKGEGEVGGGEMGGDWVVDGQKIWTSHAHQADWIYVLARTDPAAVGHRGLSVLLVPMRQSGIEVRPIRNMAGTAEFNEVFLAGARTDASLVVGEVHQGWKVAMSTLEHERGVAMLGYQNKFESEFAAALTAAHERGTIADAVLRHRLVDSFIGLNVMRYLTLRTLTGLLQGGKTGAETSLLKLVWPHWHADLGEIEMDLLGASSEIVGEDFELNPFQTTYLLSRAESIYGGTQQIHLNIVAERLLGLPRDPRPQGR